MKNIRDVLIGMICFAIMTMFVLLGLMLIFIVFANLYIIIKGILFLMIVGMFWFIGRCISIEKKES